MKLHWSHAIALAMGGVAVALMTAFGGPLLVPHDLRATVQRLHAQTLARAESDTALAYWRRTADHQRREFADAMRDSTAKYQQRTMMLANVNRRQADSLAQLARARGDSALGSALTMLGGNIAAQDSACQSAVSSCELARQADSVRIVERDSIITDRTAQRDSAAALSGDAMAIAVKANTRARQARLAAGGAILLLILSLVR